jgi:UDP-N-acetylmuramoyl-tripeptide--D-alanyl-D-alanine ligase
MRCALSAPATFAIEEVAAAVRGEVRGPAGVSGTGVSIDSRTLARGELFFAIAGPRFDGHAFLAEAAGRGAAAAVVERTAEAPSGLPLVRVADTTRALSDLASHVRRLADLPVVAITGSMGKTTTKDMTAALLATQGPVLKTEGNLNNQFGLPLTLFRLRPEHTAAVLELGMSAPGELRALSLVARPDIAVLTNVAPVHLEFFASVDEIARAKAEVFAGLAPGGLAVLNGDDPRVRRAGEEWGGRVVWFGRDRRHDVSAENARGTAFGTRFDLKVGGQTVEVALPLAGFHSVMNFLAAAAVAHERGIEPTVVAEAATHLVAAPHRGEIRRLTGGITLLDDSYNSNPEALEAASQALASAGRRRRVFILGDMLELGPRAPEFHREAGARLAERTEVLAAVGPLALHFLEGAKRAGMATSALHAFPDAAAVAAALPDLVRPGDAVLVKGSRGVSLESVVEALLARYGEVRG